jgi:hypothetical protein
MTTAMNKKRFEIGDSGWEVEWCTEQGVDQDAPDDHCPDRDKNEFRDFATEQEARKFAAEILPSAAYTYVIITPFTIERLSETWPYGRHREYTADPEYYEGTP